MVVSKKGLVVLKACFGFSTLILAFTLSWVVLSQLNFLYPIWHDHVGLAEGIERYGPENRFKRGFADTNRSQRITLFSDINAAVHNHGNGLEEIYYQSVSSEGKQQLLRVPEIVHLQDVANLLDVLKWVVAMNAVFWGIGIALLLQAGVLRLSWASQFCGIGVVLGITGAIILIVGPVAVFNQLHIWIFPDEHQWFFYYQESLMSTMMLAPKLFGWIAIALSAAAFCFFLGLIQCVNVLAKRYMKLCKT